MSRPRHTTLEHIDHQLANREAALSIASTLQQIANQRLPDDIFLIDKYCTRLTACQDTANIWIAEDLHSETTGECYNANGRYWNCGLKLCPHCLAVQARRNRRKVTRALDNLKMLVGTDLYFVTMTQTNPNLSLIQSRDLINRAWSLFRKRRYIRRIISGYAKSEEFTLTASGIHYHLHLIINSKFVKYDLFRRLWTESVATAWSDAGLSLKVQNSDDLLSCRIDRLHDRQKAIKELCKYITKSDSWEKLKPEHLLEVVRTERFPRMFELGGTLALPSEKSASGKDADTDTRHILDTEDLSDAPRTRTAANWRDPLDTLDFWQWKITLQSQIEQCKRVRKAELARKYPWATFRTIADIRATTREPLAV